jgi:hypothetical protein
MAAATPSHASPYVWVAVAVVVGIRLFWRTKPRPLRIERMWIMPALILAGVAFSFAAQPPPRLPILAAELIALAAGSGLGWWRGATTRISVDPESHALTSQPSRLGLALVAGVVLLRLSLRDYAAAHATAWRVTPIEIADISLPFAAGLVCVQRLEMWLRARRLLAQARGN